MPTSPSHRWMPFVELFGLLVAWVMGVLFVLNHESVPQAAPSNDLVNDAPSLLPENEQRQPLRTVQDSPLRPLDDRAERALPGG